MNCLCVSALMAADQPNRVAATPHPITVTQPDGDTLQIRLFGDEWSHFNTTLDGYVIVENSAGYFCYGKLNAKGEVVPSCYTVSGKMTKRKAKYIRKMARNKKLKIEIY